MRSYQEELKVAVKKVGVENGMGEGEGDVAESGKKWTMLDWEASWLRSQIHDDPGRLRWTSGELG